MRFAIAVVSYRAQLGLSCYGGTLSYCRYLADIRRRCGAPVWLSWRWYPELLESDVVKSFECCVCSVERKVCRLSRLHCLMSYTANEWADELTAMMRTRRRTAGDVRRQQWVWSDVETRGQLTEEYGPNRDEGRSNMGCGIVWCLPRRAENDRRRTERELVQLFNWSSGSGHVKRTKEESILLSFLNDKLPQTQSDENIHLRISAPPERPSAVDLRTRSSAAHIPSIGAPTAISIQAASAGHGGKSSSSGTSSGGGIFHKRAVSTSTAPLPTNSIYSSLNSSTNDERPRSLFSVKEKGGAGSASANVFGDRGDNSESVASAPGTPMQQQQRRLSPWSSKDANSNKEVSAWKKLGSKLGLKKKGSGTLRKDEPVFEEEEWCKGRKQRWRWREMKRDTHRGKHRKREKERDGLYLFPAWWFSFHDYIKIWAMRKARLFIMNILAGVFLFGFGEVVLSPLLPEVERLWGTWLWYPTGIFGLALLFLLNGKGRRAARKEDVCWMGPAAMQEYQRKACYLEARDLVKEDWLCTLLIFFGIIDGEDEEERWTKQNKIRVYNARDIVSERFYKLIMTLRTSLSLSLPCPVRCAELSLFVRLNAWL